MSLLLNFIILFKKDLYLSFSNYSIGVEHFQTYYESSITLFPKPNRDTQKNILD
jgi:hypothetical protein